MRRLPVPEGSTIALLEAARERHERATFRAVIACVVAALALSLVPLPLHLGPDTPDRCAEALGRFAPAARSRCP